MQADVWQGSRQRSRKVAFGASGGGSGALSSRCLSRRSLVTGISCYRRLWSGARKEVQETLQVDVEVAVLLINRLWAVDDGR